MDHPGLGHFVAFDVLVGRWVFLDSRSRDLPALLMVPILLLTLLFGPLGYLSYLLIRVGWPAPVTR